MYSVERFRRKQIAGRTLENLSDFINQLQIILRPPPRIFDIANETLGYIDIIRKGSLGNA